MGIGCTFEFNRHQSHPMRIKIRVCPALGSVRMNFKTHRTAPVLIGLKVRPKSIGPTLHSQFKVSTFKPIPLHFSCRICLTNLISNQIYLIDFNKISQYSDLLQCKKYLHNVVMVPKDRVGVKFSSGVEPEVDTLLPVTFAMSIHIRLNCVWVPRTVP